VTIAVNISTEIANRELRMTHDRPWWLGGVGSKIPALSSRCQRQYQRRLGINLRIGKGIIAAVRESHVSYAEVVELSECCESKQ
jgi:hypothetical protein